MYHKNVQFVSIIYYVFYLSGFKALLGDNGDFSVDSMSRLVCRSSRTLTLKNPLLGSNTISLSIQ